MLVFPKQLLDTIVNAWVQWHGFATEGRCFGQKRNVRERE
jgi:hypothetical protein